MITTQCFNYRFRRNNIKHNSVIRIVLFDPKKHPQLLILILRNELITVYLQTSNSFRRNSVKHNFSHQHEYRTNRIKNIASVDQCLPFPVVDFATLYSGSSLLQLANLIHSLILILKFELNFVPKTTSLNLESA